MSLLEITGLTHAFGGQPLFQNAAFALHRGEHVGVVGRNGAGKSTLLKLCTGQLVPDGGRIVWQGGIRVGCLDQYAALNPEHTMGEVLHGAFRALYALERAFLAVSHDAAFLNRAVTAVCAVEGRRLTKYPGNYAAYQAKKECLEGEHLRQYTAQQREIARTEAYIRKNRAGRNAKMARGRQKRLDRLERLAAPEGRSAPPVFEFQPLPAGRTGDLEVVGCASPCMPDRRWC